MVCTSIYHYLIFYRQYEQSIEIILHTCGGRRRRISSLKIVLFHVHTAYIFHSSFLFRSLLPFSPIFHFIHKDNEHVKYPIQKSHTICTFNLFILKENIPERYSVSGCGSNPCPRLSSRMGNCNLLFPHEVSIPCMSRNVSMRLTWYNSLI